ncbi:MAG: isoprenylcysteine carboxyl methyltransferase [Halioglobus sp.]|nr:isoprenylcysteine carboxyl methyltransferase [Halioglobus sp.]
MKRSGEPPASVTSMTINGIALLVALLVSWWLLGSGASVSGLSAVLMIAASYVLPIVVLEAIWLEPARLRMRPPRPTSPNVGRVAVKLLGFAVTLWLIVGVYSLFPEYRGAFYARYYAALRAVAPYWLAVSVPYFFWMDRRSGGERDGYWHMGELVLLRWRNVDRAILGQYLLGWIVKLFFLPLMFTYLLGKIQYFRDYHFELVFTSFREFYDFAFDFLFYIDLLIAFVGYLCTFKATDSHIRSTEPTLLGWAVAIMCYQPFWSFFSSHYIDYQTGGSGWGKWLADYTAVYVVWGSCILALLAIYVWASLAFGIRFSNLTHRGILTNGPYRYCKHPAYVSKCLSWWLISMPFMVTTTADESLRHCLLLLLLNVIYLLRARTEERHLAQDEDYCAYARYIEEKGLLRKLGQWLPIMKFSPGRLFNVAHR